MTNRRRILIVEDDEPTRERLVRALAAHGDELELAGAVGTCREALLALRRETPEVLLVDLALPDGNGIELIRAARALSSDILSMVVTVFGDEKSVLGAIEARARGYLLKDARRASSRRRRASAARCRGPGTGCPAA